MECAAAAFMAGAGNMGARRAASERAAAACAAVRRRPAEPFLPEKKFPKPRSTDGVPRPLRGVPAKCGGAWLHVAPRTISRHGDGEE